MANDFDPEAFAAGDFDPEAFANGPSHPETPDEAALRESFLSKKNFNPNLGKRAFSNTGPISRVRADLTPPRQIPFGEQLSGQLNSVLDRYSLGAYGGLLRLGSKLGVPTTGQAVQDIENYRATVPQAIQSVTEAPAYLAEGPANALFQAADRTVARALSGGGQKALESIPGRFLRSTGTSALGSAGASGLQAVSEGADPVEALQAAKRGGKAGLELGAALGVGAAGAGELGSLIQNSKGGKARQFIEGRGGTVSPTGVDLPGEYVTRGTSDADIGQQAEASARKGLDMLAAEKRAQVSRPYQQELARISGDAEAIPEEVTEGNETEAIPRQSMRELVGNTPTPEEPVSRPPTDEEAAHAARFERKTVQIPVQSMRELTGDLGGEGVRAPTEDLEPEILESRPINARDLRDVRPIYSKLVEAYYDPSTDPAVASNIKHVLSIMDERYTRPDGSIMMTEEHLNGLRRQLSRTAKSGVSTDERLNPLQQAAAVAKGMVDQGPYAEANRKYAEGSKRFQESRKLLGINERPKTPEESKAAVNTVKNLITRGGQNTVTAGGQRGSLDEFNARHPEIAREFDKPELLRKRADISFHLLPQHGGLIERLGRGGGHAVLPAIAALAHSPGAAVGGIAGTLALQNLPAIQARLLYGPALAAQAATPMVLGEIPLLTAARAAQQERR